MTETCKQDPNFVGPTAGTAATPMEQCQRTCQAPKQCYADNNERTSYSCREPNGTPAANNGPSCEQQYQQLMQACSSQLEDTSYTCDEKNDSGMAEVTDTASQLALMMGQQTSASIQAACSRMAGLTQAANAAVAAYRLTCSNSISSCKSACSAAKTYAEQQAHCLVAANPGANYTAIISRADSELKRCDNFQNKVNEANQAIANFGATSANASQCAALNAGDETPTPQFCAANPTHVSCLAQQNVDCTNPTVAASNKVCICQKNPLDPACVTAQKAGDSGVVTGMIDSSSRLAAKAGGDALGGDLPGLPGFEHGQLPSGGGQAIDGSQGGSGGSLGGGGGSGGGSYGSAGGGASGDDNGANVNGGFYGGGGGSRSYAGGGDSGGGGPAGASRGGAGNGAPSANGPDLRKFLPGGQFDPKLRGVAGAAGPDGITGPHSNIWLKIQNRYKVMVPSLLP
ncbi:hypothetical protein [Bdellovibrio sp. ArHS]|uniref:hypothetical protein n=1 Tax=Bdellovibrio sp. ArHS TaxID=1569284 RepID=UPI0025C3AAEA|nr:hypothetical protein [Bdellovibrio sp. ArHS]